MIWKRWISGVSSLLLAVGVGFYAPHLASASCCPPKAEHTCCSPQVSTQTFCCQAIPANLQPVESVPPIIGLALPPVSVWVPNFSDKIEQNIAIEAQRFWPDESERYLRLRVLLN